MSANIIISTVRRNTVTPTDLRRLLISNFSVVHGQRNPQLSYTGRRR